MYIMPRNICNGMISQPKGTFVCVKQLCLAKRNMEETVTTYILLFTL